MICILIITSRFYKRGPLIGQAGDQTLFIDIPRGGSQEQVWIEALGNSTNTVRNMPV